MLIFTKKESNETARIVIKDSWASWPEVADKFIHFLQACGYIVDGIDVAEYLEEQYGFQRKEKSDVFINGQEVSLPTKKGKRHAKKR